MQEQSLINIGKRAKLEDFLLLTTMPNGGKLYIVCDGVGGLPNGEIASKLAAESFARYLTSINPECITEIEIASALKITENNFDNYYKVHNQKEMATTLAMVYIKGSQATIAHVGDSRAYHIRDGKILFCTDDHKYVNELVASGFLKPEDAKTHPKRNVISRAIRGNQYPTFADVTIIEDIQISDYFMICTDGLLESITDEFIESGFLKHTDLNIIVEEIDKLCRQSSNDNFSGIFIKTD